MIAKNKKRVLRVIRISFSPYWIYQSLDVSSGAQIWLIFIPSKVTGAGVAHLHDVHLGVLEELGEHRHGRVVDDSVRLGVVAGDDVAESPEAGRHDGELATVQETDQVRDHLSLHHTLRRES